MDRDAALPCGLPPGRALVTGAARRLGRAMALALAADGWAVAVHYGGSAAEAGEVVAAIRATGGRAEALQADLLDEGAARALVSQAAAALGGPLTLLVNNASTFQYDTLASASDESWRRNIGSNLRAPFLLSQTFAAQAPQAATDAQGEALAQALIVNMLDQRVLKLTPEYMTYTLAKMGLWTLTRTLAQGLAPAIRVNAIGPGPTLQGAHQDAAQFRRQRAATVLQRGAGPADVVAALRYLIGAPSVTGQLICTDGGQHLGWKTPDILGVFPSVR